jgi:dihydroneopterin aldolase
MTEMDQLKIAGLRVDCMIGVPFRERRKPQLIELDLSLWGVWRNAAANDRIEATLDYGAVADAVRSWSRLHSFRLLETFAERMADMLFKEFIRLARVDITIRKFILPGMDHVEYSISRARTGTLLKGGGPGS